MIIRFIIYGLLGWCVEIFWTGFGSLINGNTELRGWTYLWMFPIYGLAVFLEPIYNRIKWQPLIIRGGVYTLLIFLVEYLTGWLLRNTIGTCPWNYNQSPYAIDGLIRLDYAPAWFGLGLLFEQLYQLLQKTELTF